MKGRGALYASIMLSYMIASIPCKQQSENKRYSSVKGRDALYASIMLSHVLFQYSNNLVDETKEFDLSKLRIFFSAFII